VCHLHERPLRIGERVLLKHATRTVKAIVKALPYRIDLSHGLAHENDPAALEVNDIGAVQLRTAEPLPIDAYADVRLTGAFLLIDPADGTTLTAGMAGEAFAEPPSAAGGAAEDEGWDF
jgi:sulfate adenylyltransferase subunit 1